MEIINKGIGYLVRHPWVGYQILLEFRTSHMNYYP